MENMEIEKKFTLAKLPEAVKTAPYHDIEQAYLNDRPTVRIRKQDDAYYMTYKGLAKTEETGGQTCMHEEYNLPLDEKSYQHLLEKADGRCVTKRRYLLPLNEDAFDADYLATQPELAAMVEKGEIRIELDVFESPVPELLLAEVEFPSLDAAEHYHMAEWMIEDVSGDYHYSNGYLSKL